MGRGGGSSILSLDLGEPRGTLVKQKAAEEWACQSMKRNAGGMRAELSRGERVRKIKVSEGRGQHGNRGMKMKANVRAKADTKREGKGRSSKKRGGEQGG